MPQSEEINVTPGMRHYIDKNNKYLAERDRYIREEVKKWKFDTIAVHGLYTVQDAIEDYQGAIIEPIFMSSSQAYRDSDEMAAALAYLIPTWCYSRIANPSTYYYEWTLALLEGYGFDGDTGCCSTSSGMAAIMTAVQPFLVHRTHNKLEPRNFVATAQCYGGTFQQFSVRLMEERDIECRWVLDGDQSRRVGVEDRQEHPIPLRRTAQQSGPGLLRHRGRGRPGPQPQPAADLRQHDRHARPAAADLPRGRHRGAIGDQDACAPAVSASAAR